MSKEEQANRRHAPGEDPAKRAQILEGAGRVFIRMGYDAASMNDIAHEAGVSKGTIYAYFEDKLDLFEALIDETRDALFRHVGSELEQPGPVADRLLRYGLAMAGIMCSDPVVRAHRVVIGVTERMPELGSRFFQKGSLRGRGVLAEFLRQRIATGELSIPDVPLAATQFIELCLADHFRRRLMCALDAPPGDEALRRSVWAAVEMFLCRYGSTERR